MRRNELWLVISFVLLTGVLGAITVIMMNSDLLNGLLVAFAIAVIAGLAAFISLGLEGWLPTLFALSLLASLNVKPGLSPVTFYAFDPILLGMYAGWLVRALKGQARRLRWSVPDTIVLSFLLWLLVASLLGEQVAASIDGWLLYARGFLVYFFFAHALRGGRELRWLTTALMAMLLVQSGLAMLQYLTRSNLGSIADLVGGTIGTVRRVQTAAGGLFRVRGTLNTDTSLAHWLEMLVPLGLSLFLASGTRKVRIALGIAVLAGTVAQILTFTRGGWFGLAAGVAVVVLFNWRLKSEALRRQSKALIGLAVALLVVVASSGGLIYARLFESRQDTLAVRANLNRTAMRMISDHPLMGIGLDNFVRVAPQYDTGWSWLAEGKAHKVHNVYLALATEAGLIALVLFLTFVAVVLWSALRTREPRDRGKTWTDRPLTQGLVAGLVGVGVHGFVAWGLLSYGVAPLFWMFAGLLAWTDRGKSRDLC